MRSEVRSERGFGSSDDKLTDEGGLLDDLKDAGLDGRSGERVEVDGDDRDSVGERLDVFASAVEVVRVCKSEGQESDWNSTEMGSR